MASRATFEIFGAPFELMKFELIYEGNLVASGNHNKHVPEKWDVRKNIEPQLVELWKTHPALSGIGLHAQRQELWPQASGPDLIRAVNTQSTIHVDARAETANVLRTPVIVGGKQFLPL